MSSPGSLPRHKKDIIRIIDLAFAKFEYRLQICLDEASEKFVAEAGAAQAHVKNQLSLLKSTILKGLDDPETETAPRRRRHVAPMVHTEPTMKRTWPAENTLGVSSDRAKKKTRYSNIGIDEALRELAAERSAQREQLAVAKSARKEQRALEKGAADIVGGESDPPASTGENSGEEEEEEEEDEAEGSEHDLYSTESESSASEGYKTPPSPTPGERRESRTTLPGRKPAPRVPYPGASIRGLQS